MYNKGQITRDETAGRQIYEITKLPDVHTIVDIGTWNGMGTTKCIYDAIIENRKKDYKVYTIECAKNMYEQAVNNLLPLANFNFLYGSLIEADELFFMRDELKNNKTALGWLETDILGIKTANNNVSNQMPETIDFLIIDGGEFSGEIEFKKLYERSKYIFLHDIHSHKNKNNRQFILNNPDKFTVLYEDLNEGALVCKHIIPE